MYNQSKLQEKVTNTNVVIQEQTINLGNSSNTSTIFRKHRFTVLRPNLLGVDYVSFKPIDNKNSKKANMAMNMMRNLKNKVTPDSKSLEEFIRIELIPKYVLFNPSEWGTIIKKNKDGSETNIDNDMNKLTSIREFISFSDGITMSVKFKLKVENV